MVKKQLASVERSCVHRCLDNSQQRGIVQHIPILQLNYEPKQLRQDVLESAQISLGTRQNERVEIIPNRTIL